MCIRDSPAGAGRGQLQTGKNPAGRNRDTPESKQPYGERAKQTLSDLAFGKPARVVVPDTDKYGRTVGRVYVGNLDVNAEMIGRGAAWVYRDYAKDPSLYRLENEAKAAKRGLWALPEAQRCAP